MRSPLLRDDVAQVNPNAVFDAPLRRHTGVALDQAGLNLDRATHRVDRAAEFDDCAVGMALDDAAVMGGDGRLDQIAAKTPTARKRSVVVGAGEPAVADRNGSTPSHLSREERPLRGGFLAFQDRAGKAAKGRGRSCWLCRGRSQMGGERVHESGFGNDRSRCESGRSTSTAQMRLRARSSRIRARR